MTSYELRISDWSSDVCSSYLPRVRLGKPEGAFYAFFALDGVTDSLQTCVDLARKAQVGMAPGIAFGPAGEGRIRLCYAASLPKLSEAMERLIPQIGRASCRERVCQYV